MSSLWVTVAIIIETGMVAETLTIRITIVGMVLTTPIPIPTNIKVITVKRKKGKVTESTNIMTIVMEITLEIIITMVIEDYGLI
jgi:hypothetical protein